MIKEQLKRFDEQVALVRRALTGEIWLQNAYYPDRHIWWDEVEWRDKDGADFSNSPYWPLRSGAEWTAKEPPVLCPYCGAEMIYKHHEPYHWFICDRIDCELSMPIRRTKQEAADLVRRTKVEDE